MVIYEGKAVFEGIAIGKISVYKKQEQLVKRIKIDDPEAEKKRYAEAREIAIQQLKALYEKAVKEVGESSAEIFEAHQLMVDDEDYIESVENIIDTEEVNAEYAVAQTGDNYAKMFSEMEEEYFRGRAADIKDITERVLNVLSGAGSGGIDANESVIVVADDLAPSETVQMDKEKILSFVTVHGSANSHTSILAKTMSIPAIIGCPIPLTDDVNGKMAVVIFGDMRTKMRTERLEHTDAPTPSPDTSSANKHANLLNVSLEKTTRETIDSRRSSFRQEIDVRGMRGDEAMNAVQYFIDDAILVGVTQVRILHGKGNGILRQLIRQYLNTVPNVLSARDEHVQFGGAGITVVELE